MKHPPMLCAAMCTLAVLLTAGHGAALDVASLPRDTAWGWHLDMAAFRGSEPGRYLTDEARDEELAAAVRRFRAQCSFHPLQDVTGLTLYSRSYEPGSGVLLIRGSLDADSVLSSLRERRTLHEHKHGRHVLYEWTAPGTDTARCACFYSPALTMIGSRQSVVNAIEVAAGSIPRLAVTPVPASGRGSFFCGWAADCRGQLTGLRESVLLGPVNRLAFAVGQVSDRVTGEIHLQAASVTEAQHLRDILTGVLALMILGDDENPVAAKIASGARISLQEDTVRLSLQCHADTLRDVLMPPHDDDPAMFPVPTGVPSGPASAEPSDGRGGQAPAGPAAAPGTDQR